MESSNDPLTGQGGGAGRSAPKRDRRAQHALVPARPQSASELQATGTHPLQTGVRPACVPEIAVLGDSLHHQAALKAHKVMPS